MKIKGRLVATLAALGLLIAMLPIGPASAAVGELTLDEQFYSDKSDHNVMTIEVEDTDVSPPRVGKARFSDIGSAALKAFDITGAVVGGEKERIDRLNGANVGELGDPENPNDNGEATPVDASNNVVDDPDDATGWTFTLTQPARDTDGDADIDEDDIEVVVDGTELAQYTGFTVSALAGNGLGVTEVTVLIDPADRVGNVVITYEVTEYAFDATTPIRLGGTQVQYGASLTSATSEKGIDSVGVALVTATSVVEANQAVIITFVYHVDDNVKDYVTVTSSTSLATGANLVLDGDETSARSSLFRSLVGVFESGDYTRIVNQADNGGNDANEDGVVEIGELNTTGQIDDLEEMVEDVAAGDGGLGLALTDPAQDLIDQLLPVSHGDTITVTYSDESPASSIVQTAEADLEAPIVTLVSPSDGLFTNETLLTLSANVVDAGAGVDQNAISVRGSAGLNISGSPLRAPIVDGYRVSVVPAAISEGPKTWAVRVEDKVGNTPAVDIVDRVDATEDAVAIAGGPKGVNEGAKGAGAPGQSIEDIDNPFKFTVDTSGPRLINGKTGLYLKNPGVTTGDTSGREAQAENNREWVRVAFDLGDGTAPLDASSVTTSDFRVANAEPLDVVINSAQQGEVGKGSAVYLRVGELATDARPRVELVGEIRDRAGNVRTEGTLSDISDGLAPVISVTPSATIAGEEVVITVTSSERVGLNPTVETSTTKPIKGDGIVAPAAQTVSLALGALTTWTATVDNSANTASKQYVVVTISDQSGNSNTVGDASNEDDFVSFQLDSKDPSIEFQDATGGDLEDSKQVEGAVWMVAQFDEDEHAADKFKTVTVSAMTLKVVDGDDVNTDVDMLFGQDVEVDCADHDNSDLTDKCVNITLAIDLTPGAYNFAITGRDSVGNEVSGNVDFTVVEAEPFELNLKPGVNLVSIPGAPRDDGGMLDVMLADAPVSSVLTYDSSMAMTGGNPWLTSTKDPETGVFSGDISEIEPGKAYFITSSASHTVEVKIQAAGGLPPTLPVRQGYNAIGFVSISDATEAEVEQYLTSIGWTVAYSYDPTPGIGWTAIRKGQSTEDNPIMVEAGVGYLVYSTYDSTLTP